MLFLQVAIPVDWGDLALKFGFPAAILVAIGLGIWRGLWPWWTDKFWPFLQEQIEKGQAERTQERDNFLAKLEEVAKDRAAERAVLTLSIANADKARIEERDKFMGLIAQQSEAIKAGDQAILSGLRQLAEQIGDLHKAQATSTREILNLVNEMSMKAKRHEG